jgi:plasmid maintenance system antidote protein VapI
VPDEVRAAFEAEPGDPTPGQLWRARWDDVVELVLLLAVGDADVAAAPISLDDRYADEDTVILQRMQTSLATTVAVWTGLARRLPMCVLDRLLGMVDVDVTDSAWIDSAVSAGATRGRAAVGPLDAVNHVRARIGDSIGSLAEATWAPSGTGALGKLLASTSVNPQQLVDLLDVKPQTALAMCRGQRAATPEQAEKLAPVLKMPDQAVLEANPAPPRGLVQRMSRPRRRAQVNQLATRRGVEERSAWLSATYAVYALAARQTGPQTEPAWDERIDQYFQVTLES